jgi:hypothetical protein
MTQHQHAIQIEQFITQFAISLPTHFTDGTLRIETNAPFWRALILTYGDRYGQSVEVAKSFPGMEGEWKRALAKCIKGAVKYTKQVRARLAMRMDTERVQIQRPLTGRSLLSLTTCMDSRFSRALRSLVILAIHPEHGVEGYRVTTAAYGSVPFLLPKCLQDKLPVLGPVNDANPEETKLSDDRIRELDVIVPAPKLTNFVRRIFEALEEPFASFVNRILPTRFAWKALGPLPSEFCPLEHGFVIKVPFVKPGKQVIIWSTWHATAGSSRDLVHAKATAFVDLVPRRFFVDPQDLEWYRYCNTHAPTDPGSGSSRGAYLSFVSMVVDIANGRRSPDASYGLPESYLNMFDTGLRSEAIDADDFRGSGTLTSEQVARFYDEGYLILDIPELLSTRLPSTESLASFTQFFKNISGDDTFCMDSLHRVLDMKTAEQEIGDRYTYFSRGIPTNDPLNPFALADIRIIHNAAVNSLQWIVEWVRVRPMSRIPII